MIQSDKFDVVAALADTRKVFIIRSTDLFDPNTFKYIYTNGGRYEAVIKSGGTYTLSRLGKKRIRTMPTSGYRASVRFLPFLVAAARCRVGDISIRTTKASSLTCPPRR